MERMSCHTSSAKAAFSGRLPCQYSGQQKHIPRSHQGCLIATKSLDLTSTVQLDVQSLTSRKAQQTCRSQRRDALSVQATLAEPPQQVAEETFPRGAQWQVDTQMPTADMYSILTMRCYHCL